MRVLTTTTLTTLLLALLVGACADRAPAPAVRAPGSLARDASELGDGAVRGAVSGATPTTVTEPRAAATLRELGVDTRAVRALVALDGQLAAATSGGLLVVDDTGRITRRLDRDDGLTSHDLRTAFVDSRQRLWLAARDGGCQWIDARHRPRPCPDTLADDRITAFAEHDGTLHAVTWRGDHLELAVDPTGVATLTRRRNRAAAGQANGLLSCGAHLVASSRRDGVAVLSLDAGARRRIAGPRLVDDMVCHEQTLWVAGPRGIARLDALEGRWTHVDPGPHRRHATALLSTGAALYAATDDGAVVRVTGTHGEPVLDGVGQLPGTATSAVRVADVLWFSGADVLAQVEPSSGGIVLVGLQGPGDIDLSDLAPGPDGQLVAGTFRRGVGLYSPARAGWRRVTTRTGLPSDEVNSVAVVDAAAWIGTSRGLARVQLPGGHVTDVLGLDAGLPCLHVNDLHAVPDSGELLVATSCGVGVVDPERRELVRFDGREQGLPHRIVYAVTTRGTGDARLVVAGTNDGLATRPLTEVGLWLAGDALDPQRQWQVHRAGVSAGELGDNWITALAVDHQGELVVGTYSGGLYRGADIDALAEVEGPRYVNLNAISVLPDGDVLIGGLDEGAWHLPAGSERATRLASSQLPGQDVTAFALADDDGVIVATRSGLWPLESN